MEELLQEQQNAIIADYLRFLNNDQDVEKTDEEVIELYGGDTSNKILCSFSDGKFLYESVDNSHGEFRVYVIIDVVDYNLSFSGECINY